MARSFNGSSHYLTTGAAITQLSGVAAASWAGWIYRSATSTTAGWGMVTRPYRLSVLWYSDNRIYYSAENGSEAYGNVAHAEAGWHHVGVRYVGSGGSNAARLIAYFDGVPQLLIFFGTIPSTLPSGGNQSNWDFGRDFVSSAYRYWAGAAADVSVWDVTISDDEMVSLAKGYRPTTKPVAHWDLMGLSSPEPDFVGGYNLTVSEAAQAAHPRIILPHSPRLIVPQAAAPGGGAAVWRNRRSRAVLSR